MNMSEFSKQWPVDANLGEHERMVQNGQAELESRMIMPEDDRLRIAYGLEVIGGVDAAVLAGGEPGSGKTLFGNLVQGSGYRVDFENTDTKDTMYGHQNPVKSDERIKGELSEKLSQDDPRLFANEISHLVNTGFLHRLWDDDVLVINGKSIPMYNAAIYATTNFPNGVRVNELDEAIRSRFAVEVLFGDTSREFARKGHGMDLGKRVVNDEVTLGLIPNPEARIDVRQGVFEAFPVDERGFGNYVSDMLEAINGSSMLERVNYSDFRASNGWQQAVRAKLLVEGAPHSTRVDAQVAAQVAALVLPAITSLSRDAKSKLATQLGVKKIDPLTEAIARRRLLSTLAFQVHEATKPFTDVENQQKRDDFRKNYSYAHAVSDIDKIDGFVEEAVIGKTDEARKPDAPVARKRFLRRNS